MKVALITTGFVRDESDYDGAAFLHNLAKEISKTPGIELNIFSLYHPAGTNYKFYNAEVYLCRYKSYISGKVPKFQKLKAFLKCLSLFKKAHLHKKFDIIHAVWCGESGYTASYLSKKYGIPLIANVAGGELGEISEIAYGSRLKFWQKKFVDRTFHQAKVIITGSDFITKKICSYYDKNIYSKVVKIPFGVEATKFHIMNMMKKTNPDHPFLINIATATPVKSHNDLFKALKIVMEKYPKVVLRCYGRDDNKILKNMINILGLNNNVQLKGDISYEKIAWELHNGDIFVLSSLYESQNMALLEAAFCGLPVVSTDVGIASEITTNIVPPGDYKSLAEKIIHAIKNPGTDYKGLHERFSLRNTTDKFIKLYNSVISR